MGDSMKANRCSGAIRVVVVLTAGLLSAVSSARAMDAKTQQELGKLSKEVNEQLKAKEYSAAEKTCRAMLKLAPDQPLSYFALGCALAGQKKKEKSMEALSASVDKGFDDPGQMLEDESLKGLRDTKEFDALVKRAHENETKGVAYEKGAEMPELKTVEDFPLGGLRYRVRMPKDATAENPARLIVWLHPSGGSMNKEAENLAKEFVEHGYALVVFTQKQFGGWKLDESLRLKRTLPFFKKIPGLDAEKPIILAYSAGGQMGLSLWGTDPGAWGGMIINSVYPILMTPQGIKMPPPPKDKAIRTTPFFVLVGTADQGSQFWRMAEGKWREAGVPLELHYIPGGKHEWLFRGEQVKLLLKWLDAVKKGECPGADPDAHAPKKMP